MSFWLFGKKKGEKKMDEQVHNTSNQQINDEGTSQIFQGFELEYTALKQSITRELSDYRDMLTRERNQLNVYKNKVQTRDVMEELLPILSYMKNDVLDSMNLDDLKETLIIRFKQMKTALKRVGIELQAHERNQPIEANEKINASPKATADRNLHYKVACSTKMGCIIKGEEDNPILEDIELFKYEKQAAPNNGYAARDDGSRPPMPEQQPQQQQFYSDDDRGASYQQPQRREEPTGLPSRKPDYTIMRDNAIRLEKTLLLRAHNGDIHLLRERAILVVSNTWQRFNINIPFSYISGKEEFYVYLGSEFKKRLELHSVELFYVLMVDNAKKNLVLILGERNSLNQSVQELMRIDLIK